MNVWPGIEDLCLQDVALCLETMGREGDLSGAQGVLEELETEVRRFADFFSPSGNDVGGSEVRRET